MLIGIAIAIFFKLNKGLVLIAANISILPMMPIILYLSHLTGKMWMGENAVELSFEKGFDLEMVHNSFVQYVAGAVTLATVSGLFFGLVTFLLLKFLRRGTN